MIKTVNSDYKRKQSENEEWKPIQEYQGLYEVSDKGNVRSLTRKTMGRWGKMKTTRGRPLIPYVTRNGYLRVDLCKNGISTHNLVHRLVTAAFIPNPFLKETVNHIDNNPANNELSNLEWCTHKENSQHALKQNRLHNPIKEKCYKGHIKVFRETSQLWYCPDCNRAFARDYMRRRRQKAKELINPGEETKT